MTKEKRAAASDKLIVALDVGTRAEAISLALALAPTTNWMKIGLQLFIAEGRDIVQAIHDTGARVFLDLKLHDIPTTVARAVESAAQLKVEMLTLHLAGGGEMLRCASAAAPPEMLLLGVTVLTSANGKSLREAGIDAPVTDQTVRLAELGLNCGLRGFVTSGSEVGVVRAAVGSEAKLVVPGIRPRGADRADQKRVVTPAAAVAAGADYIVVGRSITQANDPAAAAKEIMSELQPLK